MPAVRNESDLAKDLGISRRRLGMYRKYGLIVGLKLGRSWSYTDSQINRFLTDYAGKNISTAERAIYEKNKLQGHKH